MHTLPPMDTFHFNFILAKVLEHPECVLDARTLWRLMATCPTVRDTVKSETRSVALSAPFCAISPRDCIIAFPKLQTIASPLNWDYYEGFYDADHPSSSPSPFCACRRARVSQ